MIGRPSYPVGALVRGALWQRGLAAVLGWLLLATFFPRAIAAPAREDRPNIIFIVVDDLRWDDLGCTRHPFVRTPNIDRIAREGMVFRNAFATTVICSPSRASILTGLHTHSHGIIDNTDRSPASHKLATFPQVLQRAGYENAFVGKWHMGNDATRRPGFDRWVCLKGQGSTYDPELNVDGREIKTTGYVSDILSEHAVSFVRAPHTKPFLLYYATKALHPETTQRADGSLSDPAASNFIPAERHKNLYTGVKVPRRPNALRPPENKPALQRPIAGLPPLGPETGSSDDSILNRLRMLAAVDDSVGAIFAALEANHTMDRTLILFTSDQGYWYGEHGLSVERRLAYEEGIRIPLLMRYPPLIKPGTKRNQMVLTLDFAPTVMELGGATVPSGLHGLSLVRLMAEDGPPLRDAFLIEHFSDTVFPRTAKLGYQAVRTEDWKYIHYVDLPNADELYDLNRDPYEMRNAIGNPRMADRLSAMKVELARQLKATSAPAR